METVAAGDADGVSLSLVSLSHLVQTFSLLGFRNDSGRLLALDSGQRAFHSTFVEILGRASSY